MSPKLGNQCKKALTEKEVQQRRIRKRKIKQKEKIMRGEGGGKQIQKKITQFGTIWPRRH